MYEDHQKFFFIVQVWNRLLSAADGCPATEIYRSHLAKQFEDQAAKVKGLNVLLLILSLAL